MNTRSFLSDANWGSLVVACSQEDHTSADRQAQDSVANVVDDEDYLDLGDDAEAQAATTDANTADQADPQQRVTPNSSATATLNGEENGQGDEPTGTQDPVDSHQAPDQINQNEVDEIDWNHDEDDEMGVADQSPTDLSPSSLSAKRTRSEDEGNEGLGEDSGMFPVRCSSQVETKNLPAAKRRRT